MADGNDIIRTADICDDHGDDVQVCEIAFNDYARRNHFHGQVVTFSTFEDNKTVRAVLAGGGAQEDDWLLVHVAHGYSTIAIVRRGRLILFRNRPAEGDGSLADLVHQTTMYYEDRLQGGGFGCVFMAVSAANTAAEDAAILRRSLEPRLGTAVEAIDLGVLGANGPGTGGVRPDLMAAPLGLLLRERLAAETGA